VRRGGTRWRDRGRQPRYVMEHLSGASHDRRFEERAAYHLASGNEATRADDVAALTEEFDHRIEPRRIVVVIRGKYQHGRRRALREPGDHRTERSLSAVLDPDDGTARIAKASSAGSVLSSSRS